ncbi:TonB-dependent receptor domain-containing protein [Phaeobacter gallaeciensis]|uniref:Outer membrane receptor for ferrienterochelin and colicin n=1 Tax=Phaeobacter gallaeciensis TaxID=60890 RepID=A0AAC9ZBE6_9RHOB|nr:TonB-dependent receptor [Phaeobacter gallaeciensis]AHD11164.1 Outer membrane receptor for ferrienterochelin and colicin [Phaeobacter gallaeciensis DSM 26640]ATE94427.1 Outer membrane receptor for ferrienterochelin and colicin [Phaeobacter gallaeciensis]ATE98700.1 Outer membrane receptor for ferrienterochelin and colicin [Phaeobacter gallaeciensis]ATF03091.1 Outer membrane receptor for ferrienterochelin and colicin [Phaeobacter gallaeciensis]ATF07471.1 Outer membrane receptor for ferrientero
MGKYQKGWRLLSTVSVLGLLASANSLAAQDIAEDGDFLGTIELGAGKREVQTDTGVPLTVINQEEIDDRQAATIAQLVESVPGVTLVNGTTPQSSGISIRGFGADGTYGSNPRVLITIDGATTGGEEIYRIGNQLFTDPALYREISVIRGTVGSYEYGSGVVGGVVQLETKDASDFTGGEIGTRFRQTLEAQSNGTGWASSSILAVQPTEDLEFLLNYTVRDNDSYDNGNGVETANSGFRNYSYLAKGRYTFGDSREHALSAWYNVTHSDDNSVPYDILGASSGGGFYFGDVDRITDSRTAGLRYEFDAVDNDLIHFEATLTYAEQDIDSTYVVGSCAGFPGCDASVSDLLNADHNYKTTKLQLKNTSYFDTGIASHDLRLGLEITNRERLDANSAPGGTDRRVALFAVDDIQFGDRFTLTPALRYETQDLKGTDTVSPGATDPYNGEIKNDALMGGLSARYEFDSGFAVFASAAYTEVLPIIDRLDKDPSVWVPEIGTTYEAGFSYQNQDVFTSGDQLAFKVNYYDTNLSDVRVAGDVLTQVDVDGFEVEASYGMANGLYFDLNGTVADGEQRRPDGTVSEYTLAPVGSAALTVGKRFNDTLDLSWEVVAAESTNAINGSGPLPGYGVNNLRATFRPQNGMLEGTEIRLGVENVFDKQYQTQLSTRAAAGRNFKLTVSKTF